MACLGVFLLKRSGLFSGYFSDWRWAIFDRAERSGLHILPVHYYSPVPNAGQLTLDDKTPLYFAANTDVLDHATQDLRDLVERYGNVYSALAARPAFGAGERVTEFRFKHAPYSTIEAELLYGLIRSRRPAQIVEIGCGHTTLLIAEAIRAEEGYAPTFECIEPYRPAYLKSPPSEVTAFNDTSLQTIPIERFQSLQAGDILFIDSSHVVNYGSDVVYEISAILPKLNPGVLIHFHDIFLPYEYPTDWLQNRKFFWNEQYMLSAMLQDNPRYKIRFPLHQLYRQRREEMQRLFPLVRETNQRPGAYWVEVSPPRRG